MERLFGTDGVRGIANAQLTPQLAFQLGAAGAAGLTEGVHAPTILVGRDTRVSGEMLEAALVAGILSMGGSVVRLGVLPSPGVAHLVRAMQADAGVVITASHNSYEYNGIKYFGRGGLKLPDAIEDKLEALATGVTPLPTPPTGGGIGRAANARAAGRTYLNFLQAQCPASLDGMRVALDCANGAASALAKRLFTAVGAQVFSSHQSPDGININARCGSTHMASLSALTRAKRADIGLAFDGDADRVLACDENGDVLNGDRILAICAKHLKQKGLLKNDTLVVTVMSNAGLDAAMRADGIATVRTAIGDRSVLECMLKDGYSLGGEQSGHVIFLDYHTTGDGMLTALKLLEALRGNGAPVSRQAAEAFTELPQVLVGAKVTERQKALWETDAAVQAQMADISAALGGNGRIFVRASGTEPLIRILIEGTDSARIERDADALKTRIEAL